MRFVCIVNARYRVYRPNTPAKYASRTSAHDLTAISKLTPHGGDPYLLSLVEDRTRVTVSNPFLA